MTLNLETFNTLSYTQHYKLHLFNKYYVIIMNQLAFRIIPLN